ncbi:DinB family protein [Peribacillus kribbensis]|uniref:DinB family protein n=1 Tax=Peribacillus kribbensis TaxID=356658 RepID=UPI000416AC9D|nr:DinB family protein [Peribacillus kribbensis]
MSEIKKLLLNEMNVIMNRTEMFAGMEASLKNVTAKEASWRDQEGDNSIWEIVNHLIFWNSRYLNQFIGLPVPEEGFTNESTFMKTKESAEITEENWEKTVNTLREVSSEWMQAILDCHDEMLMTPPEPERTWWKKISSMNLHTAHHIGQIISIRKKQGSWEPVQWDE